MNTTDNWKKQVTSFTQVQEICNKQTIARPCFFCSWEQGHNHLFCYRLTFSTSVDNEPSSWQHKYHLLICIVWQKPSQLVNCRNLETNTEMPAKKLYVSGKEMVLVHFFTCKSYSSSLKKWLAHHLPAQLRTNALLLLTGAYSEQMFFYPEAKLLLKSL